MGHKFDMASDFLGREFDKQTYEGGKDVKLAKKYQLELTETTLLSFLNLKLKFCSIISSECNNL